MRALVALVLIASFAWATPRLEDECKTSNLVRLRRDAAASMKAGDYANAIDQLWGHECPLTTGGLVDVHQCCCNVRDVGFGTRGRTTTVLVKSDGPDCSGFQRIEAEHAYAIAAPSLVHEHALAAGYD